jgi:hypothetical protein
MRLSLPAGWDMTTSSGPSFGQNGKHTGSSFLGAVARSGQNHATIRRTRHSLARLQNESHGITFHRAKNRRGVAAWRERREHGKAIPGLVAL